MDGIDWEIVLHVSLFIILVFVQNRFLDIQQRTKNDILRVQ